MWGAWRALFALGNTQASDRSISGMSSSRFNALIAVWTSASALALGSQHSTDPWRLGSGPRPLSQAQLPGGIGFN